MYEIYLDDKLNNNYAKLDTDAIDLTTVFAISDINNVANRKETYTKTVTFKGTNNNNKAFGFAFMLNKQITVNDELEDGGSDLLFWNYNPQKLVDCYVYENSVLVLKGSLRWLSGSIDSIGNVTHECMILGDLIDFKQQLADKTLDELDFSEMSHTYNLASIQDNWNNDPKSRGYVYPLVHNGYKFESSTSVDLTTVNPFQIKNFKPAVFVSQILDKIFADSNLTTVDDVQTRTGMPYNWQLEGTEEFKTLFSNLIIPNNQATTLSKNVYTGGVKPLRWIKTVNDTRDDAYQVNVDDTNRLGVPIQMNSIVDSLSLTSLASTYAFAPSPSSIRRQAIFNIQKTFKTSAKLTYSINYKNTNPSGQIAAHLQLVSRDVVAPSNEAAYHTGGGWDIVIEDVYQVPNANDFATRNGSMVLNETEFLISKQYMFRLLFYIISGSPVLSTITFPFTLSSTELSFPNQVGDSINVELGVGSIITPTVPTGVKQIDFLNSLRNLFNLYIYTDSDTRTVIFKQYDDYYSKSKGLEVINNALDWTEKIDRGSNFKISSNVEIPKSYNFKMKTDVDYVNDYFQKKNSNVTYGDKSVSDIAGITEKKEVSVIFSPTPLVYVAPLITGQGAFSIACPWIYKLDGNNFAPLDTNIRILHYNGVRSVDMYTIIQETFIPSSNTYSVSKTVTNQTALASNFVLDSTGNYIQDLHYSEPVEVFYNRQNSNVARSYNYYLNQFKELRNPNITYVQCEVYLNENDINMIDLSVPIFIDLGSFGHSYWKLLEVNYVGSERTSTIKLQKIIL